MYPITRQQYFQTKGMTRRPLLLRIEGIQTHSTITCCLHKYQPRHGLSSVILISLFDSNMFRYSFLIFVLVLITTLLMFATGSPIPQQEVTCRLVNVVLSYNLIFFSLFALTQTKHTRAAATCWTRW